MTKQEIKKLSTAVNELTLLVRFLENRSNELEHRLKTLEKEHKLLFQSLIFNKFSETNYHNNNSNESISKN